MAASEAGSNAARALDALYRAHAAEIYRYTYAVLGNRADAEDVTQTTFVNALRALERGESPRNSSHWLITIAHNIVRQRFRQQQARPTEVELDSDRFEVQQADDNSGPTMEELVRGLQRLPPSQRDALVLREFEGRSYKQIQEMLDLTAAAVETLLFRARRSLAEELDNLVTCERAELAMSRQADGRLSRKERRRLNAHLDDCPSCAQLEAKQSKYRRAFKGLALLPIPLSLTLFKGAPSASAAAGLSTIGAGGAVAVASGIGASSPASGVLAAGLITKVAVLVAAVGVASGVGYEGVKQVQQHVATNRTAKSRDLGATRGNRPAASGTASHRANRRGAKRSGGKALGESQVSNKQDHMKTTPGATKATHAAKTTSPKAGALKAAARTRRSGANTSPVLSAVARPCAAVLTRAPTAGRGPQRDGNGCNPKRATGKRPLGP